MKFTGWYKSTQKPIYKGFYQCKCCHDLFYWDGKEFKSNKFVGFSTELLKGWRGIAK